MERYIAYGIVTKIVIEKIRDYNLTEKKDEILKQISKSLDLSQYDMESEEDIIFFQIRKDYIEKNIHEFVHEMNPIMDVSNFLLWNLDISSIEDFTPEKCPIEILSNTDVFPNQRPNDFCYLNGRIAEDLDYFGNFAPVFLDKSLWSSNLKITLGFIPLWIGDDGISIKDQDFLLYLLNLFTRNYFHSPLARNMIFYLIS